MRLAEAAEPHLTCRDGEDWLERLERERDNLRAALRWAIEAGNAEIALRLACALKRFWFIRADFVEGERWLNAALRLPNADADGRLPAKALGGAGDMAARLGRSVTAEQLFQESLTLSRSISDRAGEASALNSLGNVAFDRGEFADAGRIYRDSLVLRRQLADRRGISVALNNLGNVSLAIGDYSAAAAAHEESVALRRDLGDRHGLATSLNNLADLELRRGDFVRAMQAASEGLSTSHALSDRLGVAHALLLIAELEVLQGRLERGVRLLAGVEQLSAQLGGSRGGDFLQRVQRVLGAVGSRLPDELFSGCWTSGLAMSASELVRVALACDAPSTSVRPPDAAELSRLTDRERDVLTLVGRGRTNRQIADELVISEGTAAVHVKHILRKLGCASRAQAAVWAVQHGLLAA